MAAEISYKIIHMLFLVVPNYMHWTLVIVLIVVRELNAHGIGYLGQKIAGFLVMSMLLSQLI